MIIIMLGAQGTGKGTVAGILQNELGIPQVSTGDIFRKNIKEQTKLGIEANKYIAKGNLVPDEITVPMVVERLNEDDAKNGVILDGFPRTIEQAKKLDEILENAGKKIDLVVNLTTPREEIITRILCKVLISTIALCSAEATKKYDNNINIINTGSKILASHSIPIFSALMPPFLTSNTMRIAVKITAADVAII